MAEIPVYTSRAGRHDPVEVNPEIGVDAGWERLAALSTNFANKIGKMADAAAQQEGYIAGLGTQGGGLGRPDLPPVTGPIPKGPGPGAGPGSEEYLPPATGANARRQQAMAFYTGKGLSQVQAAGLVGNLEGESAFAEDVIAGTRRGDAGAAGYVGQWTKERLAALHAFAGENPSWEKQLEFSWHELETSHSGILAKLKAAKTVDEATMAGIGYEAPQGYTPENPKGGHRYNERLAYAQAAAGITTGGESGDRLGGGAGGDVLGTSAAIEFLTGRGAAAGSVTRSNPVFRDRLAQALAAAEKATGVQARVGEMERPPEVQAQYYANYTQQPVAYGGQTYRPQKQGGLAAPPGRSRHQSGNAADIPAGPVLSWLHKNAGAFGLEFLKGRAFAKDPVHIQLAGGISGGGGSDTLRGSGGADSRLRDNAPVPAPLNRPTLPPGAAVMPIEGPTVQSILLTRGFSIRDQAYDKGALAAGGMRLEGDAKLAIQDIATRYALEPEKIAPAVEQFFASRRTMYAGQPEMQLALEQMETQGKLVGGAAVARQQEEARAETEAEVKRVQAEGRAAAKQQAATNEQTAKERIAFETDKALDDITTKYMNEPEKIGPAIRDYALQRRKDISDPADLLTFDKQIASHQIAGEREANAKHVAADKDNRQAIWTEVYETQTTVLARLARKLGTDPTAQNIIADRLKQLEKTLSQQVGLSATERQKMMGDAAQIIGHAQVEGAFDRLNTPEQRQVYHDQFVKEWQEGDNELGLEPATFEKLDATMRSAIEHDEVDRRAANARLDDSLDKVIKKTTEGYAVPNDELTLLRSKIRNAGTPELENKLTFLENWTNYQTRARQRPPEELTYQINALETQMRGETTTTTMTPVGPVRTTTGGASEIARDIGGNAIGGSDVQWHDAMVKLRDSMTKELDEDPLTYAEKVGYGNLLPQFRDFGDWGQRRAGAEAFAKQMNRGNNPTYFRKAEVAELMKTFAKDPDELVRFALGMKEGFGSKDMGPALKQLSKEAPVLGQVLGVSNATGDTRLIEETAIALKRQGVEGYEPLKVPQGAKAAVFGQTVGQAFMLAPDAGQDLEKAADLLADHRMRLAGIDPTSTDQETERNDIYTSVLNDLVGAQPDKGGGFGRINDFATVLPVGITADRLDEALNRMTDQDLARLPPIRSSNGVPVNADQFHDAKLVAVGGGQYRVALGDPTSGNARWMTRPDGEFWTVNPVQIIAMTDRYNIDFEETGGRLGGGTGVGPLPKPTGPAAGEGPQVPWQDNPANPLSPNYKRP